MRHARVVLLHGFTGAPASYDTVHTHLTSELTSRVCAPYLPGHGSSWARDSASERQSDGSNPFEAALAPLTETLRSFGVSHTNPAILVGYSLGARVALSLLLRHPDWFESCLLIGANPGLEHEAERTVRRRQDELRAEHLLKGGVQPFLDAWENEPLFASQRHLAAAALEEQTRIRQSHTAEGLAYCLRHLGLAEMPNYWPALSRIGVPTHALVGALDEKFVQIAKRMQALVPQMALSVASGVGHNVVLEAPHVVATAIERLHRRPTS